MAKEYYSESGLNEQVGAASVGEDPLTLLYGVLRDPLISAETVEEFSSTNLGYSAWSNSKALPSQLVKEPVIGYIKQSLGAFLATENNSEIRSQITPWTIDDVTEGDDISERATEIGEMSVSAFDDWVATENVVEISLLCQSYDAFQNVTSDFTKSSSFTKNQVFMDTLFETQIGLLIFIESPLAIKASASSVVAMDKIFADTTTLESILEIPVNAGYLGTESLSSDMILSDTTTLNFLISLPESAEAFFSEEVSVTELSNNPTALTLVAEDANSMSVIFNDPVLAAILIDNQGAFDIIEDSEVASTALFNSSEGLDILLANPTSTSKALASPSMVASMMSDPVAMPRIINDPTYLAELVTTATSVTELLKKPLALREVVISESNSTIAEAAFMSQRNTLQTTVLANSTIFSNNNTEVGNGSADVTVGVGTNTIYYPYNCYDDNDTTFYVYSLLRPSVIVASRSSHSGNSTITSGLTLRGTRVDGVGSSVGYVGFYVYTVL